MASTTPVHLAAPDDFDVAVVERVVAAAREADGVEPLDEAALLALRHDGIAGTTLLLAGDPADPVGLAWVRGGGHGGDVALVVVPSARGAGVGTTLAAAVVGAAPEVALSAWSHGDHPAAARLAGRLGFARVRDLWVMRRPLHGLPPLDDAQGVARAAGVVVRPFRPGHDEEAFLALNAEAFAAHPEQGSLARADLERRMAEPWFDPDGFFLAERRVEGAAEHGAAERGGGAAGADLLGFHWTKVHEGEPPHGEVYVVGVSPRAQGLGLGRLLTLTGLHHLAGRGLEEVVLYVESDNAPAVAVYSRLGFTHRGSDTHVQYRRDAPG